MNDAINNIVNSVLYNHLDDFLNDLEYETDHSDFVNVDGEEGDYGVIRYLYNGKCFMVNFNFAGDWEENILTEYGIDLVVRPIFNPSIKLDIKTIDGEDRVALLQYFGNTMAKKEEYNIGDYLNSPHIDQEPKDNITDYLNELRNLGLEKSVDA